MAAMTKKRPSMEEEAREKAKRERRREYARQMAEFEDRDPGDILNEYAWLVEQIRELNTQVDRLKSLKSMIEAWAIGYAGLTGLDKITSRDGTLSVTESMRAKYEPERWNDILLDLVGIDVRAAERFAARMAADQWLGASKDETIRAELRRCLTPGNLHVVQRRLTDTKVMDIAVEGVPLPEGLSLEPWDKIHWTAAKVKKVTNIAENEPAPLDAEDS